MADAKEKVADFWNATPCGSQLSAAAPGSQDFFVETERRRYLREPFICDVAGFDLWRGKKVLEVGCGMGADLSHFALAGARITGIDLSEKSIELAHKRLEHLGLTQTSSLLRGDAENLPFEHNTFDFVYSWGVIHHTPDTARAARELMRVLRSGGRLMVMIYNRHSLVAFQAWVLYALLAGKPSRKPSDVIASHLESPGTKAFTVKEMLGLFSGLKNIAVTRILTPYDRRIGRNRFLPKAVEWVMPNCLGYFMVLTGEKPI